MRATNSPLDRPAAHPQLHALPQCLPEIPPQNTPKRPIAPKRIGEMRARMHPSAPSCTRPPLQTRAGAKRTQTKIASYHQSTMPALTKKVTLADLRACRATGRHLAMLTCYDYTTARLMHEAGVPLILVGDSAASVILGHDTTLPVTLNFMIEITAAVRRGTPNCLLVADMPFGSYQASLAQGVKNVARMVKRTGCDAVKLEVADRSTDLVRALADAGVAIVAHLGLKPQSVGLLGGYRFQGRTASEAQQIVASSLLMEDAGAAAILLEAVPPEVATAVVKRTSIPVIGCGAGPSCHSSVIVTQDGLGLTPYRPRFVPALADHATPLKAAFEQYVQAVAAGSYPASEHDYVMPPAEKETFQRHESTSQLTTDN